MKSFLVPLRQLLPVCQGGGHFALLVHNPEHETVGQDYGSAERGLGGFAQPRVCRTARDALALVLM